ncbi:Bax inhibitor-1/YccA family protein [Actinomyces sp. ZJ308]|uniref:Bax inhibitor-1/YccA family protein n=1 Tax=Actinomyces sp. ZJ308 TaxID=2708342 RepID=UPI001421D9C6|nr:Bax inhibitor-1/YccA family protein [Actinomyces sp. ZJ308]
MSNPFFSRSAAFQEGARVAGSAPTQTPNGYPTMPGYQAGQYGQQPSQYGQQATDYGQQYGQYGQASNQYGQTTGYGQVSPEQMAGLEAQYQAPSATNADMRRMTYDDVIIRTAGMFAVILALGALSWNLVTSTDESAFALGGMAMLSGIFGSLVLGIVNSFKREPSPALILAYAAFEGLLLGGISGFMEARYEGIVVQAVLATLATFGAMLAAYSYGGFRVQGRFRRVVVVATLGYALFSLINLGLSMTGVVGGAWGLRSMTIMGIPLGIPLGIIGVILASLFLAIDFEFIENGVRNGLPQRYAWAAAFGLVVTIVWLYVEFLRLLSYFRD